MPGFILGTGDEMFYLLEGELTGFCEDDYTGRSAD
jgi:hypothetical protein